MHTAFFGIKKVHWRIVGLTQRLLRRWGMTAARFDLMRILRLAPHQEGVAQSTLKWLLGVAAPTVSRMLKSLEKLGFVVRDRSVDRRCLTVRLTRLGRVTTNHCMAACIRSKEAEWMAARGVLGSTQRHSKGASDTLGMLQRGRDKLGELLGLLGNMRTAFRDTAPFPHPWRMGNFLGPLVYATFDQHGEISFKNAFTGAPA